MSTIRAEGKLTPDDMLSGSQVAAILGRNPYQTPNDILKRAIDILQGYEPPAPTHESIHWGNTFEVDILNEACKRLKLGNPKTTFNKAFFHKQAPLAVSLDGMVQGNGELLQTDPDQGIFLVNVDEIVLDGDIIVESKLTGQELDQELPDYRGRLQIQAQMACTGAQIGVVAVLYRGVNLRIYVFKADPEIQQRIIDAAVDFDRRLKKYQTNDEIEWYPIETVKDATNVYDEDSGEVADLPQIEDHVQHILNLKQDIQQMEEELEHYQAQVMATMGDVKVAHAGRYQVTWGTINYKAVPEKVVPAKPARIVRSKTLRIKENG